MKNLLFAINVDWYFDLHWRERVLSKMTSGYKVQLCLTQSQDGFLCSDCKVSFLNFSRSGIGLVDNVKSLLESRRLIRASGADLIHSVTVKPNLFFGICALVSRLPIVFTIPGLGSVFSSSGLRFYFLKQLLIILYWLVGQNKKSFFAFENKEDESLFQGKHICSASNSSVVPGAGVDIDRFFYSPDPSTGGGPVIILFAGRLLKGKGLDDLISAVKKIADEGGNVRVDVAGIIDEDSVESIPESQIEQWCQEGYVNWLGRVDDMPSLLSRVHMVVLPTRYGEGLPRILLEAAACGRPVIASDVPGCRDFVEDGVSGLLVPPGDVNKLATSIRNLLDEKQRVKLGQVGREIVENHYTLEKVIDQYKEIYLHLAG